LGDLAHLIDELIQGTLVGDGELHLCGHVWS
jgi:hypothetical protein